MSKAMRAKMVVTEVTGNTTCENLKMRAVCKSDGYPADGKDENNSFATWTPSADLSMCVTNPELIGQYKTGDTFYVDFTPVLVVQRTPQ